jgi:hypothetical protein
MTLSYVAHQPVPKRNVLLYGPPKTKKTTAACSAPKEVLLINADLPNAPWYARSRYEVKELDYKGFAQLMEIQALAQTPKCPFETIVVDPVGELYRLLLEEFSNMAISPSLPTYQAVGTHIERFCRALCKSPYVNTVLVCHEHPVKNEVLGGVENLPWTGTQNPALGMKLMSMVDVIGFTGVIEREDGELEYVAQLVSGKGRRGGDRSHSLGSYRALDLGEWFTTMAAAMAVKDSAHKGAEGAVK